MDSCYADLVSSDDAISWIESKKSLDRMYSKRYAHTVCGLAQDFQRKLEGSLAELDSYSKAKRVRLCF